MNVLGRQILALPTPTPGAGKATPKKGAGAQPSPFDGLLGQAGTRNGKKTNAKKNVQSPVSKIAADNFPAPNISPMSQPMLHEPVEPPPAVVNPLAKAESKVPVPEKQAGVDQLTRRVVWIDFLHKMKSKLGVNVEDILKAFNSLSPQDLAKPPDQAVDKIVLALGLNGQHAQLARQYFHELIQKTKSNSLGDELLASRKQIDLTLMSQRELQKEILRHSLAQMNNKFFVQQPPVRPAAIKVQGQAQGQAQRTQARRQVPFFPEATRVTGAKLADTRFAPPTGPMPQIKAEVQPQAQVQSQTQPQTQTQAPIENRAQSRPVIQDPRARELNTLVGQMQKPAAPVDPKEVKALLQKIAAVKAAETRPQAAVAPAIPQAVPQSLTAQATSPSHLPFAAMPMSAKSQQFDENSSDNANSNANSGSQLNPNLSHLNQVLMADKQPVMTINGKPVAQTTVATGSQAMAVPDLVQQAHVMVKKGGGEMKVLLHPDGLGEVAMKVNVNHGKVSIQMITESDQAKRLIQHELGDLKAQLAANHLHLDKINVDTAANLGRQMEQQYQDAQRQALQTAWQQFRQNNEGWRQSFFQTPSAQFYRGQTHEPRDVSSPNASAQTRSVGSRRLDLVA